MSDSLKVWGEIAQGRSERFARLHRITTANRQVHVLIEIHEPGKDPNLAPSVEVDLFELENLIRHLRGGR